MAPNQQKLAESDGRLLAQVTAIPYGYPTCIVCVCICTGLAHEHFSIHGNTKYMAIYCAFKPNLIDANSCTYLYRHVYTLTNLCICNTTLCTHALDGFIRIYPDAHKQLLHISASNTVSMSICLEQDRMALSIVLTPPVTMKLRYAAKSSASVVHQSTVLIRCCRP